MKSEWYIKHSAKGTTWEEHKYIKRIDGTYYYPDSYKGGRHLPDGDSSLFHYGIPRRSGRYRWGSGERPYQGDGIIVDLNRERKKMNNDNPRRKIKETNDRYKTPINPKEHIEKKAKTHIEGGPISSNNKQRNDKDPLQKGIDSGVDFFRKSAEASRKINKIKNKDKQNEKVDLSKMSDEELRKKVNRLNLEQQYYRLTSSEIDEGNSYVSNVLDTAGDVLAAAGSALAIAIAIKKLKG